MWKPYDSGKTRGTLGTESGVIVKDEEHADGARITIEKDGINAPFGITCGIYGLMFHTAFASNDAEAAGKYQAMKNEIERFFVEGLDEDWRSSFVDKFYREGYAYGQIKTNGTCLPCSCDCLVCLADIPSAGCRNSYRRGAVDAAPSHAKKVLIAV
jgi:hypothetical protein